MRRLQQTPLLVFETGACQVICTLYSATSTANVAEHYGHGQLPPDGALATVMANLATITSDDCETVAALTKTIAALSEQVAAKDMWTKATYAAIKHLNQRGAPAEELSMAAPAATYVQKSYKTNNDNYCWYHGYQVGLAHTNTSGTNNAPGHKNEATKDNIMGGTCAVVSSSNKVGTLR
jgi:hypothetical protein